MKAATIALTLVAAQGATLEGDRRHELPNGWAVVGDSHRDTTIELAFAVKNQGMDVLEKTLLETSDPAHTKYGQHLSKDGVQDLTHPKLTDIMAVQNFLKDHTGTNGDCVTSCVFIILLFIFYPQANPLMF